MDDAHRTRAGREGDARPGGSRAGGSRAGGSRAGARWRDVLRAAARACAMFLLAMLVVIVIDTSVQAIQQAPSLGVSPVHAFTTLAITLTAVVGLVGGALTVAVAAVAVGPAWLVASALRRVGSTGVQLAVWTVFGALTGLLVVGLSALVTDDGPPTLPETVVVVVVAAASVDYGWWRVSRSRRRPLDDEGVERAE